MARKRRLPFDCFACGKCFKSAQAVRGHRRHCRYPRLRREAEAQAGAQPEPSTGQHRSGSTTRERPQSVHGGDADRIRRRPGPLSYETKLLLLEVQEAIEQLREDAREFGGMAYQFARMNVAGQYEQAQDWARRSLALDDCLRELDPMLPAFQVDRGTMYQIYKSMRRLKEPWLTQLVRACRFVEMAPDGVDAESRQMLRDEEARFTRIVEHLQHLVAAAP
jgi:hypothetical protein